MLRQALKLPVHLAFLLGVIALPAHSGPSGTQSTSEARTGSAMIDPMVKCMLSNLDMQKAEELGALVAASGAYWVPSPGGGISDPYLLKHFDGTVPSQRKRFSAVVNAESTIVTVLGDGADRCGIDEEEFEHGVGTLLGTENGTMSREMVKEMPERIQKIWAAFRVVRSTLLNSDEFRQGYQRTVAEHGRSDK